MRPSSLFQVWGTVTKISSAQITVHGVSSVIGVGDEVVVRTGNGLVFGEFLQVTEDKAVALLFSSPETIRIGDRAYTDPNRSVEVGDHWLGQVINYRGESDSESSRHTASGSVLRSLNSAPPRAQHRRRLGSRLSTGLMVTDTLLPICRGQRLGLFAGSGVGKSTLISRLANGVHADRIVIALIGERSREINDFAKAILSEDMLAKTCIVAATASDPPGAKKRAAYCAITAAEHFRDAGHNVLLLFDSITRFAEAHREVALMAGETPALNAFPPSTVRVIAELAERTGPGGGDQGDITAIFSVLVAGSDLEEPVADMIRGIIDGHIVLSRDIAERGRYPAIDVLKSVSRSLPDAASAAENGAIQDYRKLLATYDDLLPMLRANLYQRGTDHMGDRAIDLFPALDRFITEMNERSPKEAFDKLNSILAVEGDRSIATLPD